MKLYELPPTRSMRVRWTLQELGAPFDAVRVNLWQGEHLQPAFLAINPAGKLPALVDGDVVVTESIAIMLYLCEKYPSPPLLPSGLAERAQAYRWMLYAATELEQPLWRMARHTRIYDEAERLPAEIPLARRDFKRAAAVLEGHIQDRDHLAGDAFTAADIACAYTLDWANELDLLDEAPIARAYMERCYARPAATPRIRDARTRA